MIIGSGSDRPELDYTAQTAHYHSYGLQAYAGFTLNSGNVKIECVDFVDRDIEWWAAGVFVRAGDITVNDGSLKVVVRDLPPGTSQTFKSCEGLRTISTSSTVTINGGNIDLTVSGKANTQRGIDASGNVTVNAGTITVTNTNNNEAIFAKGTLKIGEFTDYTNCEQNGKYLYFISNDRQEPMTTVTLKSCAVTWKNWNGDTIAVNSFASGSAPVYNGETPTGAEDARYTFASTGDSAESTALITAAKNDIDTLNYDTAKTLDENKTLVDAILANLKTEFETGACSLCGAFHGNDKVARIICWVAYLVKELITKIIPGVKEIIK